MKWFTNCPKADAEKLIAKYQLHWKNRKITIGDPKPGFFTVDELKAEPDAYVGLYDEDEFAKKLEACK